MKDLSFRLRAVQRAIMERRPEHIRFIAGFKRQMKRVRRELTARMKKGI